MNINDIASAGSDKCCGCTGCASACPRRCISMDIDSEGFRYPTVDTGRCTDCGACVKVCPFASPWQPRRPTEVYAAWNKDSAVRRLSSSGGVFTLLAERTVREGGVVFGARFTPDWRVEIAPVESVEGLAAFRGSKYLQADMGGAFSQARKILAEGRKVLFCGTPCQVAGLRHFLRKAPDNLLAVDFVCHGVPSPKVWEKYLDEIATAGRRAIADVQFRDKPDGWKRFNFTLRYDDGAKTYCASSFFGANHYMRAFLADMTLRPSCHNCLAKSGRSHSDITIADYWGVGGAHPEMDDDGGTSLIMVNTDKGRAALDFAQMEFCPSTYADALRGNPSIEKSVAPHAKRSEFFAALDGTDSVVALINKQLRPSLYAKARGLCGLAKRLAVNLITNKGGAITINRGLQPSPQLPACGGQVRLADLTFRNKANGWKGYSVSLVFGMTAGGAPGITPPANPQSSPSPTRS